MARSARRDVIDPEKTQILHCTQRCVRRAFLCGDDPYTGQSFEHRRQWILDLMQLLSSIFAIDCLTYSILSNHFHVVLRSRCDIVATWSDRQVAWRWLRLYPKRRDKQGNPKNPTKAEVARIMNNRKRIKELRRRLSDVSWWMRYLAEKIARRSNKDEGCTGRFWQGRFRCVPLLDETSLLACTMYADLNPVRAAMAKTPETSAFTGAKDRIDDLRARKDRKQRTDHHWERSGVGPKSGWLSPMEIDERHDPLGADGDSSGRRASKKGFLRVSVTDYLALLDWTGRSIRDDKQGAIPEHLAPILSRIGLDADRWCMVVSRFGKLFKRVAGTAESLSEEASRRGVRWLQGPGGRLLSPNSN